MNELNVSEEVNNFIKDWKGNVIEEGDTLKIICYQKLKNPKEVKEDDGVNQFVVPEFFNIRKSVNEITVKFNTGDTEYCFEDLGSWEVKKVSGSLSNLVIQVADLIIFGIESLQYLLQKWCPNCIIAIEGKSDDQEEFFLKYFEL